jgi:hypothetical protein
MLAHLLAFASAYVALEFIAPLEVLLVLGPAPCTSAPTPSRR